jgi:hypothetical protein
MARDPRTQAKAYVKSVLSRQERRGAAKVSKEEFDAAVDRAAAGFASLTSTAR